VAVMLHCPYEGICEVSGKQKCFELSWGRNTHAHLGFSCTSFK